MDKNTTILLLVIGIVVISMYAWYQYKEAQYKPVYIQPHPLVDPINTHGTERMIII